MNLKIFIDKHREEEILIYTHEKTKLIDSIEQLVSDDTPFIGYKEREAIKLDIADIYCFTVEDNKIFALLENEKLQLKSRLYKIEEKLPLNFIKINQSAIANIRKIAKFNASVSGTLMVVFKNGYKDYVSRRNLKNVKERLGL